MSFVSTYDDFSSIYMWMIISYITSILYFVTFSVNFEMIIQGKDCAQVKTVVVAVVFFLSFFMATLCNYWV